jgi:hypothetical protein
MKEEGHEHQNPLPSYELGEAVYDPEIAFPRHPQVVRGDACLLKNPTHRPRTTLQGRRVDGVFYSG